MSNSAHLTEELAATEVLEILELYAGIYEVIHVPKRVVPVSDICSNCLRSRSCVGGTYCASFMWQPSTSPRLTLAVQENGKREIRWRLLYNDM